MSESVSPMEFVGIKMEVEVDEEIPEDGINLSIINELKAQRHLWDPRHKLYKDSEIKKKSWSELARKLGVREPFLKTRWRSLRDRYMKERRREIQLNKSGQPRKNRPWQMMHRLDFLNKAVQPRNGNTELDGNKLEENEDCEIPSPEVGQNFDVESPSTVPNSNSSVTNVPPTYLIINPDNTIQCLPSVQLPPPKTRPLRRIEPATSESPRNVTLTVSPTASVAGTSTMTSQVQHVQTLKPVPRLSPAPITANWPAEPQAQEFESSEHYFYLSIAKEMESRSTRVRLKMRKIISDALFKLYEEEEETQEGSTTQ